MGWFSRIALAAGAGGCLAGAGAASPTPALQQKVRAATFEVVIRKTDPDPLTYERPLPLELLPYQIRNDAYWSIGTAFAIGPNAFISAAHVIEAPVGGQLAAPALRDADGRVFPIDRILKFSHDQDFVVFAVAAPPPVKPLVIKPEHHIDQVVFAAGNALGQGIVIRDGLLTSETAEDREGRWKWLRYSAAASPGSSGGPLLDSTGAVVGVITAKSPAENLNFALPISAVRDASTERASIDSRDALHLLIFHGSDVHQTKGQFSLPRTFGDFAKAFEDIVNRSMADAVTRFLDQHAGEIFPRGGSAKALASPYFELMPTLLYEDDDKVWQTKGPENSSETDLGGDGQIEIGTSRGVAMFRLQRPNRADSDTFYEDPKPFSDLLLKGLKISRAVAGEAIRVTSLGAVQADQLHLDRHGRVWQIRSWWLGYDGTYLLAFCLPTPEGYSGFAEQVPGLVVDRALMIGKLLADYTIASYSGTPAQWQAFLARTKLRPAPFDRERLALGVDKRLQFESDRIKLDFGGDGVHISDRSVVNVLMGHLAKGETANWDVFGITLREDIDRFNFVRVVRYSKPASDAGPEPQQLWQRLRKRESPYDDTARSYGASHGYGVSSAVGAPATGAPGLDPNLEVLYEVTLQSESATLPREMEDREQQLVRNLHVLEH